MRALLIFVPLLLALLGYIAEGGVGLRTVALMWLLASPVVIMGLLDFGRHHEPR